MASKFLVRLRDQRADVSTRLTSLLDTVETRAALTGDTSLTDAETTSMAGLEAEAVQLDERIGALVTSEERSAAAATLAVSIAGAALTEVVDGKTQTRGQAVITAEPKPYVTGDGNSWMRDLILRHEVPGAVERLERQERAAVEVRASTTATFNGLVPPQFLIDLFARTLRAGRVTPDLVAQRPMPPVGMSAIFTRSTAGTTSAIQTAQNVNPADTDMTTVDVTVPIATVQAASLISRQTMERGGLSIDNEVMIDMAADVARQIGTQALFGTGAAGQVLGIENTAGIIAVAVTNVAVTGAAGLLLSIANALQQINTQRFAPGTHVVMHPRRWGGLTIALDTTGRPIVQVDGPGFNAVGSGEVAATQTRVGTILGVPVYTDPNIRTNLGVGTNEDSVIVMKADDVILWGGNDMRQFSFEQPLGPASIRLAVYGNFTFSAARYPVGVARLSGAGLVPPTF